MDSCVKAVQLSTDLFYLVLLEMLNLNDLGEVFLLA